MTTSTTGAVSPPDGAWGGALVSELLRVQVLDHGVLPGLAMRDLFGMALRINPRRPHLLVSTVLAKHVPTDPRVVRAAGLLLGVRVAAALGRYDDPHGGAVERTAAALAAVLAAPEGDIATAELDEAVADLVGGVRPGDGFVFGYAETATALGQLVGRALGLPSVHSTRREVAGFASALDFDESHSHATAHRVLADPALLTGAGPAVLVDDELSTGSTALNTVRALHRLRPRERYLIAALVDVRTEADRARMAEVADELGTRIDVVALAAGEVVLPDGARAEPDSEPLAEGDGSTPEVSPVHDAWPAGVPPTARHGFTPADETMLDAAADRVADALAGQGVGQRVLVLGTEELMYAPLAIADALRRRTGGQVRFSTTTRSPVRVLDRPGYAVTSGVTFAAHDRCSEPGPRFAYNVARPDGRWDDIVVVVDTPAWTERLRGPGGALAALAPYAGRVRVVVLPDVAGLPEGLHGPAFGSYDATEVTWLLKDLSDIRLEADTDTRERAIQAGRAHYAESLPVEYQPEPAYSELFTRQLHQTAARVAEAVGAVTELARLERGRDDLVLASLARAGTPIGILMRRWAQFRHGHSWPHHAVSIVRDRGIDMVAMRYLAAHYDPRRVLFVDGWTGKGAITREFAAALAQVNADLELGARGFAEELAVLADPGECVDLFGTREDFLIPSACLNSTVSGLVSRTVLNADLIGPDDFHGAKFYAELADRDVSAEFLDAITDRFDEVADDVERRVAELRATDRRPTWVGWRATDEIRAEFGIGHINLVKPGVGETTRVLLRRVPWKVVVNPERRDDLKHVELLAADRGVEVVPREGLPYSCIGLIRPTEKDG